MAQSLTPLIVTVRALEKAKKVIAVELDPRMGAEVTKRVQGTPLAKKLEVILGDVIKMPELPACDALISNTPYQISSPLIFKMLAMKNPPRVAVLMVGGIATFSGPAAYGWWWLVSARICKEIGGQARGRPLL